MNHLIKFQKERIKTRGEKKIKGQCKTVQEMTDASLQIKGPPLTSKKDENRLAWGHIPMTFQNARERDFPDSPVIKTPCFQTFLVVQWIRIHLPMQGTWV